jgi:hypothetical protein
MKAEGGGLGMRAKESEWGERIGRRVAREIESRHLHLLIRVMIEVDPSARLINLDICLLIG